MPWKVLNNFLYDGNKKSPVPAILLKSGAPPTHIGLITQFINNGPLNFYLNKYMNNFGLFRINKEELLLFIKKCIIDYKIKKYSAFYSKRHSKDKLFDILRDKFPSYKNNDIALLADLISKSPERTKIFESLGLDIPKVKKGKKKKLKKISQKAFIVENFVIMDAR